MMTRETICANGTVLSTTFTPACDSPVYFVRLATPDGILSLKWLGRREIPGIGLGASLRVKGIPVPSKEGKCLINPDYELLKATS